MTGEFVESFPLCAGKSITGTRRLAREKILQILVAFEICGTDLEILYKHIFYRDFNFEEPEAQTGKLLTPQEINELEADVPIIWKQEESEFAYDLMNFMINSRPKFDDMIQGFALNWDINRIALIDKLLIHMAAAEIMYFPEIPVKVSLNEVIEVGKDYSTGKTSSFINGILEKMLIKLEADGLVNKTGRGLSAGSNK